MGCKYLKNMLEIYKVEAEKKQPNASVHYDRLQFSTNGLRAHMTHFICLDKLFFLTINIQKDVSLMFTDVHCLGQSSWCWSEHAAITYREKENIVIHPGTKNVRRGHWLSVCGPLRIHNNEKYNWVQSRSRKVNNDSTHIRVSREQSLKRCIFIGQDATVLTVSKSGR